MQLGDGKFAIGQSAPRKEDVRFLTGQGRYMDDLPTPPGTLRGYVLRSPYGHARIASADAEAARQAPGVRGVWLWADIAGKLADHGAVYKPDPAPGATLTLVRQPHLARGVARYVGEPVAFIVAENLNAARDAAELIEVDYDPLPVPADPLAQGAAQLHEKAPGNAAYHWAMGDKAAVDAAFAGAAHVIRERVSNHRVIVASMEPRGVLATHEDGNWNVWMCSQGAHLAARLLAKALGVEVERVRAQTPDVGGAFGMKLMEHPEYGLAALAAQQLGAPVKWIGDRSESMLSDSQGRALETEAEAAFDAEGRILAMRWRSRSDLGAYVSSMAAGVHSAFSQPIAGGMYRIPCFDLEVTGHYSCATPVDAYRGAGRPEAIYVTERLMDAAALHLGLERTEIRRRNLLTREELPFKTVGGLNFDSLDCAANLDRVRELADAAGFPARRGASEARGLRRGFAVSYYMERTGGGNERAEIELTPDGRCLLRVGTQSSGQGHETAWAQVAHDRLGIDWDRIFLQPGDSAALSRGGGTGGSKSLIMASRTLILAGEDLVEKARPRAAEKLEAAAADIEFQPVQGGRFVIAGTDRQVSLFDLVEDGLQGEGEVGSGDATFPNGAHAAEVELDPETGGLRVLGYWMVDDFGALANPMLAAGQAHGGVAQGVGQAIMERAAYDAEGQALAGSFMDYAMPRAADLPPFVLEFNRNAPTPSNPLGVKGSGEAGSVGAVPAVVLAVYDALRSAGADIVETPLTPEKLWRTMRAAG